VKKILLFFVISILITSCFKPDRGELTGTKAKNFSPNKPPGMSLIPSGSYLMGMSDDDMAHLQNAPVSTVSIKAFYMDETEITNGEYRQFVNWVRDSVVRVALAERAIFDLGETPSQEDLDKENSINKFFPIYEVVEDIVDEEKGGYELYKENNFIGIDFSDKKTYVLNYDNDLIWERDNYPDLAYAQVMEGEFEEGTGFFLPKEESYNGERTFNTKKIIYNYTSFDAQAAIKSKSESRKLFFKEKSIAIYPDTTVWIKDFSYSYNEPMHNNYFWHDAYTDYPVVGVSWEQAKAFAHWRTMYKNQWQRKNGENVYLRWFRGLTVSKVKKSVQGVPSFRLPSEAEWEYAARGGIESATYPWGGPYTTDSKGYFLANFKPNRGDYASDNALYTVEANSYWPNDFGLYNMSGNVSEWTESSYDKGSYDIASGLNPKISDSTNLRKVIRGGSWKDVAYFLRVSSRDYEYKDEKRSYIGFRTVQDYLGEDIGLNQNSKKIKNK
jgi:formylglycine-generating enzyme|tara:strand:- start:10189 stop:11682 length:1494 start_codon:yes stop_codon:yes gene_type:complete